MTTISSASVTPILVSTSTTPIAGGMSIDLVFNTAMAAGSGTIMITDGAVQTVIDRATGQPTMRVVGATDTHTVSAASVSIAGSHVSLTVAGLLPDHAYSIVMGAGVLASSAQVAFGGLRSTSQLQFSTAAAPDTEGPVLLSSEIDGKLLASGGSLHLTLTFSEAVKGLTADALHAPNASVSALVALGDGHSWQATLTPSGAFEQAGNVLSVDMSKVRDASGNAGSGSAQPAQAYDVDTRGPSASITLDGTDLRYGAGIGMTLTLSDRASAADLLQALSAQNALIGDDLRTSDDGLTWQATLRSNGNAVGGDNTVSLDLSKLHDSHGNAGAGIVQSQGYAVDNAVSAYVGPHIGIIDQYGPGDDDHVSNAAQQRISFSLSGPLASGQHIALSIDGHAVSSDALHNEGNDWYLDGSDALFADGSHTVVARVVDSAGHGSAAVSQQFTIDTVAPTLEHWPEGAIAIGAPDALELSFGEAVYLPEGGASIVFSTAGGTDITVALDDSFLSADHKTLTIRADQHHLQAGQDYQFHLPAGLTDLAGNAVPSATPVSLHVATDDLLPPSAIAANAQVDQGLYGIGASIGIAIGFNEAVKLAAGSGAPVLHLNNGGLALLDHISSDQHTLVFNYTVGASDSDTASLQLDGSVGLAGHVSDLAGNLLDAAHIDLSTLASQGAGGPLRIDAHAPSAPGAPVLDTASDSGISNHDGITRDTTPTLTGTGGEAGATIKVYEGEVLLGSTTVDTAGKWSFTVGSQADRPAVLADGVHTLTARQVDAAGNASAASGPLAITIDTVAPTVQSNKLEWNSDKHRFELAFSEKIVFAAGQGVDVLDTFNLLHSHYAGSSQSNWEIGANDQGVQSVLELNLGGLLGLFGNFYLKADNGAIQDVAGNAAVIGQPSFDIPGITH